jgi:hypothetical protein
MVVSVLACGLLAYSGWRAARLGLTHDEAISLSYGQTHCWRYLLEYKEATANHHLVNSVAVKLLSGFLGTSEFVLRLPSLLAHILYLVCSALLVARLRSKWLAVAGFACLTLNPYLLDFFSLSRGYSLALGFFQLALCGLLRLLEPGRRPLTSLILAVGGAVLATWSNFAFLNAAVWLLAAAALFFIRREGTSGARVRLWGLALFTAGLFLLGFATLLLLRLKADGALYFGGQVSLYEDSFVSLLQTSLYRLALGRHTTMALTHCCVAMLVVLLGAMLMVRSSSTGRSMALAAAAILAGTVIFSLLQHLLAQVPYPQGRTALALIPTYWVAVLFSVDHLAARPVLGWIRIAFAPVAALAAVATAVGLNVQGTLDWAYDANTKDAVRGMLDVAHTDKCKILRVVCHWVYGPAVEYYLSRSGMPLLSTQRDGEFITFDLAKDRDIVPEDESVTEVYYIRSADMNRLGDALLVQRRFHFSGSILALPLSIDGPSAASELKEDHGIR